jgi:hypothetical protein
VVALGLLPEVEKDALLARARLYAKKRRKSSGGKDASCLDLPPDSIAHWPHRQPAGLSVEGTMSRVSRSILLVLWIVSLVCAAEWGARAQETPPQPGIVLSGPDVGFRVDGQTNGKPYGAFVVRMNGKWAEVGAAMRSIPARQ